MIAKRRGNSSCDKIESKRKRSKKERKKEALFCETHGALT